MRLDIGEIRSEGVSPWLSERAFKNTVLGTLIITGVYMLYSTFL